MRLIELQLKNFRCFAENGWPFDPCFNVLAGDNGTGKTAILEAIIQGVKPYFQAFHIRMDGFRQRGARVVAFNRDEVPNLEPQYPVSVRCVCSVEDKQLEWTRAIESKSGRISSLQSVTPI